MRIWALISAAAVLMALPAMAQEETVENKEAIRVLYLTRSVGFTHGVVKRSGSSLSHSEEAMTEVAESIGAGLTCTQDASLINKEDLAKYDVVIFYTTGDLTEGDDGMAMPESGVADLREWVQGGGGFVGIHPATDTFHGADGQPTPYIELVGGEFAGHGRQFVGTHQVVDPSHPTMAFVPAQWRFKEEWYVFKNLAKERMRVLGMMIPGDEGAKQEMYAQGPYPITWCMAEGQGRVYYTGLGHREDVWDHGNFRQMLGNAIRWAAGHGPVQAEPNYQAAMDAVK